MNFFVTVRKNIKEMMNESPLKGVGNLFLLLGVIIISLVQFCWWMGKTLEGAESGLQYLFIIIFIICELVYMRQMGIIICSIGALLLIIYMVKKMYRKMTQGGKR